MLNTQTPTRTTFASLTSSGQTLSTSNPTKTRSTVSSSTFPGLILVRLSLVDIKETTQVLANFQIREERLLCLWHHFFLSEGANEHNTHVHPFLSCVSLLPSSVFTTNFVGCCCYQQFQCLFPSGTMPSWFLSAQSSLST